MTKVTPPLRGGSFEAPNEATAQPKPSYPALCRQDTTSWNHGTEETNQEEEEEATNKKQKKKKKKKRKKKRK